MNKPDAEALAFSAMTDDQVKEVLSEYSISLTVDEARIITDLLGRDPTVVEAIIWGIQGSEHCSYKSSRRFLKGFVTDSKHVILGPVEDSGIVALTDGPPGQRWALAIAHESHNHPSQIVPYEGAATGVGGVVRDIVCMGARVIGCMDMLRMGDLRTDETRSITREVIRGIAGYANPLGLPNLGGDTTFDSCFNGNCLVNALAVGLVREDRIIHSYVPDEAGDVGYDIILVGKPTDRSGFGGASFASADMEEDKRDQNSGAVQEPNPFLERHLLASTYELFDWLVETDNLKRVSCKDLGAGGVVCATVEQVADRGMGAHVHLDKVHTAMGGLPPEVIACAETQERLCFTCHPDLTQHILRHYNVTWDLPGIADHAGATLIGKVTSDPTYVAEFEGKVVCSAAATAITEGLMYERPTEPITTSFDEPEIACDGREITFMNKKFDLSILGSALVKDKNGCGRTYVTDRYDKNVIGNTVIEAGEADAGVITPLKDLESYGCFGGKVDWSIDDDDKKTGVAFAADGNGRYGRISPYLQGANAVAESMRNVAATGALPRTITDCLNYGNPEHPGQLWQLEQGVRGIADTAAQVRFDGEGVPVVSGNVSLYNSKKDGSGIDPSAIVCTVGVIRDASKAVNMHIREANLNLVLIGERRDECGGSLYHSVLADLAEVDDDTFIGNRVPETDPDELTAQVSCACTLIDKELLKACHDISDGGLWLAALEMLMPWRGIDANVGMRLNLDPLESPLRTDTLLFTQTGGFLCACESPKVGAVIETAEGFNLGAWNIGSVVSDDVFEVSRDGDAVISHTASQLKQTWLESLADHIEK